METQLPFLKRARAPLPEFSAHDYCGQTAGWIRMPLDMEVCLGLGHNVLDGDPAPHKRGTAPPLFGPCLLWPNGWIDQDATWYQGRPRPRPHCVTWRFNPPIFGACLLWPNGRPSQLLLSTCYATTGKSLNYRRETARPLMSVELLSTAARRTKY